MHSIFKIALALLACTASVHACTNPSNVRDVTMTPYPGPTQSTTNAPQLEVPCGNVPAASRGHWYKLSSATAGVRLYITTCTANTNFDTFLQLYESSSSDCSVAPTCTQFADGVPGDADAFCSTMELFPVAGKYYWVYVTGYQVTTGSYSLNVDTNPPPSCFENAIDVRLTSSGFVDTGATGVAIRPTCDLVADSQIGQWFKYAGDDYQLTLTISSSWDTRIVVYNSATGGCNNCACSTCSSVIDDTYNGESVTFNTVPGKNYYFFVTGINPGVNGSFSFSTSRVIPKCQIGAPLVGANTMIPMTISTLQTGTTSSGCALSSTQRGRWFKVTGLSGNHYFTTCGPYTEVPTQIAVFRDSSTSGTACSTLTCEGYSIVRSSTYSAYCTGTSQSVVSELLAASSTYYVFVGAPSTSTAYSGNVTLYITTSLTSFPGYEIQPPAPSTSTVPSSTSSSRTNTGAIVGGAVGGFFAFFIIIVLISVGCTRWRRASAVVMAAPATVVVQQPQPIVTAQPVVTQTTTYTNSVEMSPYGGQPGYGQPQQGYYT